MAVEAMAPTAAIRLARQCLIDFCPAVEMGDLDPVSVRIADVDGGKAPAVPERPPFRPEAAIGENPGGYSSPSKRAVDR